MKFGKQIKRGADPAHLNHCIAYDVLKKAITVVTTVDGPPEATAPAADVQAVQDAFGPTPHTQPGSCRPPDSRFHGLLQHELAKVNRFFSLQLRTLLDSMREVQKLLAQTGAPPEDALSHADQLLEQAANELVAMENFRRLNFTGFRKIVKKFDKQSSKAGMGQGTLASWFVPQLVREFFVAAPLDPHLLALSLGYAALRRHRRGSAEPTVAAPPPATPGTPGASTKTFWLQPAARMRAYCTLIKSFEVVVPSVASSRSRESAGAVADQLGRLIKSMLPDGLPQASLRLAAENSVVYYDGPHFPVYMHRICQQGEEATAVGFRCRQTIAAGRGTGSALVERDAAASAVSLHPITPVEAIRSPDAFPLYAAAAAAEDRQAAARALQDAAATALGAAAGTAPPEQLRRTALGGDPLVDCMELEWEGRRQLAEFAREVSKAASGEGLAPVATVGSSRLIFKGDSNSTNGVFVAVDEDVQFSRGQPAGPAAMAPSDVIDFSYCLLEVASNRGEAPSKWLDELRSGAMLRSVTGFNIGAQAVATLHKDVLSQLPDWYPHLIDLESQFQPEAWGLTLEWRAAVNESVQEEAAAAAGAPAGSKVLTRRATERLAEAPAPERPTQVAPTVAAPQQAEADVQLKPKDFLASERTMLEWMHTILALAFLGIGLWKYSLSGHHKKPALLGLLNARSGSTLALGVYSLVLVLIAVVFAWAAVLTHLTRLKAIMKGETTERVFNGRRAPVLFAAAVGLALLAHLGVQMVPLWTSLGSSDVY